MFLQDLVVNLIFSNYKVYPLNIGTNIIIFHVARMIKFCTYYSHYIFCVTFCSSKNSFQEIGGKN